MSILEAECTRCKETFVPHGTEPDELIHGVKENGEDCGGIGIIMGEWVPRDDTPLYDFGKYRNLTAQELHGLENPGCPDPDCEWHHPELIGEDPFHEEDYTQHSESC
jgi:hypothetical protein